MTDQPTYANMSMLEVSSKNLVFTVGPDQFAEAVSWASKMLPSRPTAPVLNGILLTGDDTGLTVSAFDYEVSGRAQVATESVSTAGSVLVSGRLLASIAGLLPNKPVEFSCQGPRASLTCGKAKYSLPTMDIDSYPALPILPDETGTVEAELFAEAVTQVVTAAGRDETVPMLTGVRMEIAGTKVRMVTTDRFRLALREFEWTPVAENLAATLLVPAKTLAEACRSGDGTQIHLSLGAQSDVGEGLFGISGDTRRTTTRLLNVEFPEYGKLLPDEHTAVATIDVAELTEVIKRVALLADRNAQVRLQFSEGNLQMSAGADELGDAQEDMDIDFAGEELTIAFNPNYLTDGLSALKAKRCTFGFIGPKRPAVLQAATDNTVSPNEDGKFSAVNTDFKYVLMPVRITG